MSTAPHPRHSVEFDTIIDNYRPASLTFREWEAVADFTRQAVRDLYPAEDSAGIDRVRHLLGYISQPTPQRRTNTAVVLCLCLGAGLRAGELCCLRARDVTVDEQGAVVRPYGYRGAAPRFVPVHATYSQIMEQALAMAHPDSYVFRPGRDSEVTSQLSAYLHCDSSSPLPPPDTRRLRNTWIVHQILQGVPSDVLCQASGLNNLHQFADWVKLSGQYRAHRYRMQLQGGEPGGPFTPLHGVD